jgi:uncharacterized C2H2 Zn-finger protein
MPTPTVRQPHDCPYCPLVYYSKGALTRHVNAEHWNEKDDD